MPDPPRRYGFQRGLCLQQGPFLCHILAEAIRFSSFSLSHKITLFVVANSLALFVKWRLVKTTATWHPY